MRPRRLLTTAAIFILAAVTLGTNVGRAGLEVATLTPADIRRPVVPLGPEAGRPPEVPPGVYWASWLPEGFVFTQYLGEEVQGGILEQNVNYWHGEVWDLVFGHGALKPEDIVGWTEDDWKVSQRRLFEAHEELWEKGIENSTDGPRVTITTGPAVDQDHVRAQLIENLRLCGPRCSGDSFEDVVVRGQPGVLQVGRCPEDFDDARGDVESYRRDLARRGLIAPSGYPWQCPWSDQINGRVLSWNETPTVTIEVRDAGVSREDLFRIAEGLRL